MSRHKEYPKYGGLERNFKANNRPADPPAAEKCGKCKGDGKQRDSLGRIGDCECKTCGGSGYRPPAPEPAESEGKDDEFCDDCGGWSCICPTAPQDESTATEDARAFKRVAHELRIRFPVEIQYNSEFEAMVKRLEMGRL